MNCLHPFKRRVEKYDKEIYIPCGHCVACRVNKTREWTQRLMHESYISESCYFVTLTYNEDNLPYDLNGKPCVYKEDIQLFFKRLRKMYPNSNIRYFVGSEYGDLGRPHYHALIFNLPQDILDHCKDYIPGMPLTTVNRGHQSYINRKLNDVWKLGYTTIGEVCRERVSYCAKYFVNKQDVPEGTQPNFNLMSRRPGIGADYLELQKEFIRFKDLHSIRSDLGTFIKLPRYYDKKLYSDAERAERWTSRVDAINKVVENDPIFSKSIVFSSTSNNYDIVTSPEILQREKIAERNYKTTHKKDLI